MGENEISRRDLLKMLAALGIATSADALAQDPAKGAPGAPRVLLENARVRVLEFISEQGHGLCGEDKHSHPEYLSIALTPVKVKLTMEDGHSNIVERKAGDLYFGPAGSHTAAIVSGKKVRTYIVEIKVGNWKPST